MALVLVSQTGVAGSLYVRSVHTGEGEGVRVKDRICFFCLFTFKMYFKL